MTPNTPLSDDELGAMLGQSVRSKVDDVPTITPAFDGVERRARQITNRRRTAAGLAVGALALFGGLGVASLVSDDEDGLENDVVTDPDPIVVEEDVEPIEETEPEPAIDDAEPEAEPTETEPEDTEPEAATDDDQVGDDPEPVVVATPWMDPAVLGINDIESDTNIADFGPVPAPMVGFDENGVVYIAGPVGDGRTSQADLWQIDGLRTVRFVEDPTIDGDQHFVFDMGETIVHVNQDKQARVIADASRLVGAGMVDGRPAAFITGLTIAEGGATDELTLTKIDLLDGSRTELIDPLMPDDFSIIEAVVAGDTVFVEGGGSSVWDMLTGGDGTPLNVPNSLTGPDPATVDSRTLSADGSIQYWIAQVDVTAGLQPVLELRGIELATGGAVDPVTVTLPASQVALDYDISPLGDQLLLVRSWPGGFENGRQTRSYVAPLLLDPGTGAITELGLEFGFWKPVGN